MYRGRGFWSRRFPMRVVLFRRLVKVVRLRIIVPLRPPFFPCLDQQMIPACQLELAADWGQLVLTSRKRCLSRALCSLHSCPWSCSSTDPQPPESTVSRRWATRYPGQTFPPPLPTSRFPPASSAVASNAARRVRRVILVSSGFVPLVLVLMRPLQCRLHRLWISSSRLEWKALSPVAERKGRKRRCKAVVGGWDEAANDAGLSSSTGHVEPG